MMVISQQGWWFLRLTFAFTPQTVRYSAAVQTRCNLHLISQPFCFKCLNLSHNSLHCRSAILMMRVHVIRISELSQLAFRYILVMCI